jgi:hypothetical protein
MANDNLPTWPGASTVYSRCYAINIKLCAAAYQAWKALPKRTQRMSGGWQIPECVTDCIAALKVGDEEALKAYVHQHLDLALAAEAEKRAAEQFKAGLLVAAAEWQR